MCRTWETSVLRWLISSDMMNGKKARRKGRMEEKTVWKRCLGGFVRSRGLIKPNSTLSRACMLLHVRIYMHKYKYIYIDRLKTTRNIQIIS